MECPACSNKHVVKNGKSRHGHQRWICRGCAQTFGEHDHRCVSPEKREAALAHYLEGVGLRATERLVGVSHNSVMNWVLAAVKGRTLQPRAAETVEWIEADELWTYIAQKKRLAGSGGLLIALPKRFAAGRWGIVAPGPRSALRRSFLTAITSLSAPTSGTPTASSSKIAGTFKARRTPSRSKVKTTGSGSTSPASGEKPTATPNP